MMTKKFEVACCKFIEFHEYHIFSQKNQQENTGFFTDKFSNISFKSLALNLDKH